MVQFIGAMLQSGIYKGAAGRQIVNAALVEEAVKLSTVNGEIELYSAKPILRGTVTILEQQKKAYEELLGVVEDRKPVLAVLREMRNAIKLISSIVENTKEAPDSGSNS